jgi:predicted transcriptional regulator of viral defense system
MANAPAVELPTEAKLQERSVAPLAARQYGVVTRRQLLALGLSRNVVNRWLRDGRLHPLHRGVYAVGHPRITIDGAWMAAVLASGPGAVISHRSAAMLWGIRRTDRTRIEITAPRAGRSRASIEWHESPLADDEVTVVRGIPVTTVPRTLLDLAAVLNERQLARALNEAEVQRLGDALSLDDVVRRHPNRQGVTRLRALTSAVDAGVTRRELEKRFREFIARTGLPRPQFNAHVYASTRWFEIDRLASGTPRGRAGRPRNPCHAPGVRERPAARPHDAGHRLAGRAGHVAPAARLARRGGG